MGMNLPITPAMQPAPLYPPLGYETQQAASQTANTKQEVIRVAGLEGAYKCVLPANTGSIIVVDAYKPLAYLITTNGINRNVSVFDIKAHVEPQNCISQSSNDSSNSIQNDISATLATIMEKLNNMEVTVNELKSTDRRFKSGKRNGNIATEQSGPDTASSGNS